MTDTALTKLTDAEISEIKEKVYAKLVVCKKINDIIGTQVFGILKLYARVIFYPLGENAPWGVTRIKEQRMKRRVYRFRSLQSIRLSLWIVRSSLLRMNYTISGMSLR